MRFATAGKLYRWSSRRKVIEPANEISAGRAQTMRVHDVARAYFGSTSISTLAP